MLTTQNIREKTFEKAVFGGYDMGSVDDFLEELANDFESLAKENATLKGKMKVLVNKIEEYRSNEDALRAAMISAQRLGTMIEQEARAAGERLTSDAAAEAERMMREAKLEVEVESARLAEAKTATARYIESMELLCRRQSETLQRLRSTQFVPESAQEAQPAAAQEAPVQPEQSAKPAEAQDNAAGDAKTRSFSPVTPEKDADIQNLFSVL